MTDDSNTMQNPYLQGVIAAPDVFLIDENVGDRFLSCQLMQQVLVVSSILWNTDQTWSIIILLMLHIYTTWAALQDG